MNIYAYQRLFRTDIEKKTAKMTNENTGPATTSLKALSNLYIEAVEWTVQIKAVL